MCAGIPICYSREGVVSVASGAVTRRIQNPDNPQREIGAVSPKSTNFRVVVQSLGENWIRVCFGVFTSCSFVHTLLPKI